MKKNAGRFRTEEIFFSLFFRTDSARPNDLDMAAGRLSFFNEFLHSVVGTSGTPGVPIFKSEQ